MGVVVGDGGAFKEALDCVMATVALHLATLHREVLEQITAPEDDLSCRVCCQTVGIESTSVYSHYRGWKL